MHVQLLVPRLLDPVLRHVLTPGDPPALAALEMLFARGRRSPSAHSLESWLQQAYGLDPAPDEAAESGLAALGMQGDGLTPGTYGLALEVLVDGGKGDLVGWRSAPVTLELVDQGSALVPAGVPDREVRATLFDAGGSPTESMAQWLEKTAAKRVILATPVTLISVLKGVAYSWRQERLATNTEELRKLATELYDRARAFAENYAETGRNLARALDSYNRSVGSWDTRLDPSLRRMRDLGVGGSTEVPSLPKTDSTVRQPKDVVQ